MTPMRGKSRAQSSYIPETQYLRNNHRTLGVQLSQTTHSGRKHFAALDGIRGIAAIAVVLYHSYEDGGIVPNGLAAVDLFFILSGFVVGMAYDDELRDTMSFREFMIRRVVRLYPMIFLASILSVAIAVGHNIISPSNSHPWSEIVIAGVLSTLCLPYLGNTIGLGIFPFNPVLWSLFFELFVNGLYALNARRWKSLYVVPIVLVSAILVAMGPEPGGGNTQLFLWGFPRVFCGFFGGVLLSWAFKSRKLILMRLPFWLPAISTCLVLAIPFKIVGFFYTIEFIVLLGIIAVSANVRMSYSVERICYILGQISYPIYTIHWLTLYLFAYLGKKIKVGYDAIVLPHLLFAVVISYVIALQFEKPICAKLGRRLIPSRNFTNRYSK